MSTLFHRAKRLIALVALVASAWTAQAQDAEKLELQSNLQASANRVRDLQARLEIADRQQLSTSAALASANESVKDVTSRYETMRAALAGVGAAAILGGQNEETQQNLLSALAELKAAKSRVKELETSIQSVLEKLALPGASTGEVSNDLTKVMTGNAGTEGVSLVAATRPEQGLAIVTLGSGVAARAGAKVSIGSKGGPINGIIVEARQGAACVSYEQGLGINSTVEIGSPVQITLTSKL